MINIKPLLLIYTAIEAFYRFSYMKDILDR